MVPVPLMALVAPSLKCFRLSGSICYSLQYVPGIPTSPGQRPLQAGSKDQGYYASATHQPSFGTLQFSHVLKTSADMPDTPGSCLHRYYVHTKYTDDGVDIINLGFWILTGLLCIKPSSFCKALVNTFSGT